MYIYIIYIYISWLFYRCVLIFSLSTSLQCVYMCCSFVCTAGLAIKEVAAMYGSSTAGILNEYMHYVHTVSRTGLIGTASHMWADI